MKTKELLLTTMKELEEKEAMKIDGGRVPVRAWKPNSVFMARMWAAGMAGNSRPVTSPNTCARR